MERLIWFAKILWYHGPKWTIVVFNQWRKGQWKFD
jgi:hypothetical protein